MYNQLEQWLDLLISGLMNGFVIWLAIAFVHYVYTRNHQPTGNPIAPVNNSEFPQLSIKLSLPYSSEIRIPVIFSLLTLLQVQTIAQLKAIAKELNLSGYSKQSKATLVKRIIQAQQRQCFHITASSQRT
jgi:hypothetical protein